MKELLTLTGRFDNKSYRKLIKVSVWHYVLRIDLGPRIGAYKLFGRLPPKIQWSIHTEEVQQSVCLASQTCVVLSLLEHEHAIILSICLIRTSSMMPKEQYEFCIRNRVIEKPSL